jgi:hypothetical protein
VVQRETREGEVEAPGLEGKRQRVRDFEVGVREIRLARDRACFLGCISKTPRLGVGPDPLRDRIILRPEGHSTTRVDRSVTGKKESNPRNSPQRLAA